MSPRTTRITFSFALVLAVAAGARVPGQCSTQWLPGPGMAGTDWDGVRAMTMWDPDGAGPIQPVLVVGGNFQVAGSAVANSIAAYDPVSGVWSALGSGMSSPNAAYVNALATLPNGDLVAGGEFTSAGGVSASNIARWNGTSWSALAKGMDGNVHALATLPNGDFVAGGQFTLAGGVSVSNVARWNGTSWSALGSGISGGAVVVYALTPLPNGDVVAGGQFTSAGGVSASNIARWDGKSWSGISPPPWRPGACRRMRSRASTPTLQRSATWSTSRFSTTITAPYA